MISSPDISSFPIELSLGTIVLRLEITGECDFYSRGSFPEYVLSLELCNRINLNNPKTKIRWPNEILRLSQRLTFQPPSLHLSQDLTIAPYKCILTASPPFPPCCSSLFWASAVASLWSSWNPHCVPAWSDPLCIL